jgi:hypothetical protein
MRGTASYAAPPTSVEPSFRAVAWQPVKVICSGITPRSAIVCIAQFELQRKDCTAINGPVAADAAGADREE